MTEIGLNRYSSPRLLFLRTIARCESDEEEEGPTSERCWRDGMGILEIRLHSAANKLACMAVIGRRSAESESLAELDIDILNAYYAACARCIATTCMVFDAHLCLLVFLLLTSFVSPFLFATASIL